MTAKSRRGSTDEQHKFALIICPGLEQAALNELRFWWPRLAKAISSKIKCDENTEKYIDFPEYIIDYGVLEFQAPLFQGLMLNHLLKVPTRILMRIASFRCRDFPKLHKQASKINWKSYCKNEVPNWEVAASKSRVAVEKKIEKTCIEAFKKYWKEADKPVSENATPTEETQQTIYVRIHDDDCTISVDTSGTALYKRGIRSLTNSAPIRETLASALIYSMSNEKNFVEDQKSNLILWDPMTGSGCIPLEATNLLKPILWNQHPFYSWKISIEKNIRKTKSFLEEIKTSQYCSIALGSDNSEKAIESAKGNLKNLKTLQTFKTSETSETSDSWNQVEFEHKDFFKFKSLDDFSNVRLDDSGNTECHMLINPPYDVRLATEESPGDFYQSVVDHGSSISNVNKIGMIIPAKLKKLPTAPSKWSLAQQIKFKNGGIPVNFLIFTRS